MDRATLATQTLTCSDQGPRVYRAFAPNACERRREQVHGYGVDRVRHVVNSKWAHEGWWSGCIVVPPTLLTIDALLGNFLEDKVLDAWSVEVFRYTFIQRDEEVVRA